MGTVLGYYFYLLSFWAVYRYFTHFSEGTDEFIAKPIIWLVPIICIILFAERRHLFKGIHLHFNSAVHDILWGLAGSLLIFGLYMGSIYLKRQSFTFNPNDLTLIGSLPFLVTALATGFIEEMTFRGFIFSRLRRDRHYVHYANILTTVLFIVIHIPMVLFVTGDSVGGIMSQMAIIAELSLIDGYLFHTRAGLVAPIVAHATWNFASLWMI